MDIYHLYILVQILINFLIVYIFNCNFNLLLLFICIINIFILKFNSFRSWFKFFNLKKWKFVKLYQVYVFVWTSVLKIDFEEINHS